MVSLTITRDCFALSFEEELCAASPTTVIWSRQSKVCISNDLYLRLNLLQTSVFSELIKPGNSFKDGLF